MEFITKLPRTSKRHDSIMVVMEKLAKVSHFILVKLTHKETNVVDIYMREIARLYGIPKTILSERDPKFNSKLWKGLFNGFVTNLNFSTTYHPESDGQTKSIILSWYWWISLPKIPILFHWSSLTRKPMFFIFIWRRLLESMAYPRQLCLTEIQNSLPTFGKDYLKDLERIWISAQLIIHNLMDKQREWIKWLRIFWRCIWWINHQNGKTNHTWWSLVIIMGIRYIWRWAYLRQYMV